MSIRIVSYDNTTKCIVIQNDTGKEKRGRLPHLPLGYQLPVLNFLTNSESLFLSLSNSSEACMYESIEISPDMKYVRL